jgi:hypothetical protein
MGYYPFPRGLLRLPVEVLFLILNHLTDQELFQFAQLSKFTRELIYQNGQYQRPVNLWKFSQVWNNVYNTEALTPEWLFENVGIKSVPRFLFVTQGN